MERKYIAALAAPSARGPVPEESLATLSPSLCSIDGLSDEVLLDGLLMFLSGQPAGAVTAAADEDRRFSAALARMKYGPCIPPFQLKTVEPTGGDESDPDLVETMVASLDAGSSLLGKTHRSTASKSSVAVPYVGPWLVSEASRGILWTPKGPEGSVKSSGRKATAAGSPTPSTASLPSLSSVKAGVVAPTVVSSPDNVSVGEGHPLYAPRQNLLLVVLPLCGVPQSPEEALAMAPYLNDVRLMMCWDVMRSALHPLVDNMLLVAPPLTADAVSRAASPIILQPHGLVVSPVGASQPNGADTALRVAPAAWSDVKKGSQLLQVEGGWSHRCTMRRVAAVHHWAQAVHLLVSAALPFGHMTFLLPRHTNLFNSGAALWVKAEQRVDASLRNVLSPAMEPEALLQSAESGDRKLRGSEMLVVDSLRSGTSLGDSNPDSSSSGGHASHRSARSDDDTAVATKRHTISRAAKLLQSIEKSSAAAPSKAAATPPPIAASSWPTLLQNSSCASIGLVYEVAAQLFGTSGASHDSSDAPVSQDLIETCYRLTIAPPAVPNIHWLQRVDELCEQEEEGVAAIVLEDCIPAVIVLPTSSHKDAIVGAGCGIQAVVDETLVACVDLQTDVQLTPLAHRGSSSSAASSRQLSSSKKGAAAVQTLGAEDPATTINSSADSAARMLDQDGSSLSPSFRPAAAGGSNVDALVVQLQGVHQWAYQRTSALPRPADAVHAPIDACRITLTHRKESRNLPGAVVNGTYALTPVATPMELHKLLSAEFGWDGSERVLPPDEDDGKLSHEEWVAAASNAKNEPTDSDLEHRAWIEGLLETPGHVLYRLELDVGLLCTHGPRKPGTPVSAAQQAVGSSSLAEVLKFNAVMKFIEDVNIVSLHVLRSDAFDEHGVRLHSSAAESTPTGTASSQLSVGSSHGSPARLSAVTQISSDTLLWGCPIDGRIVRGGTKAVLSALVVLDVRARSGAHDIRCTLTSNNSHLSSGEWSQVVTVVSSAAIDFAIKSYDPAFAGGASLVDPSVALQLFPSLSALLGLRAAAHQTELSSLHDAVHVGGVGEESRVLRGERASCVSAPPVACPVITRSSPTSGFVLWNFRPSQ